MTNHNGKDQLPNINCINLEYIEKQSIVILLSHLSKWIPQELKDKLFYHLTQAHTGQAEECSNGQLGQCADLLPASSTWDGRSYWKRVSIYNSIAYI